MFFAQSQTASPGRVRASLATGQIELCGATRGASAPALIEDIEELQLMTHVPAQARRGSPSATVVLIEFGDYECPYCRQHVRDVYPEIVRDYIESGQVQYAFRHFPIERHALSLTTAAAAECARVQGTQSGTGVTSRSLL